MRHARRPAPARGDDRSRTRPDRRRRATGEGPAAIHMSGLRRHENDDVPAPAGSRQALRHPDAGMMTDEVIHATSEEPSAEDARLRTLVTDLISQQNKAMIDLAKSMLTITFTAIGVVLALQEHWFGGSKQTGAA